MLFHGKNHRWFKTIDTDKGDMNPPYPGGCFSNIVFKTLINDRGRQHM